LSPVTVNVAEVTFSVTVVGNAHASCSEVDA